VISGGENGRDDDSVDKGSCDSRSCHLKDDGERRGGRGFCGETRVIVRNCGVPKSVVAEDLGFFEDRPFKPMMRIERM